ncbi:LysM peptidoglycan-binding domain-containing protein [Ornithinibacillus halotolerans]|uniref:LysM domain-containing protein n=1 Tax=Ornithinibacillus halotolerans TaxID=1274357 RepID=A0A916RY39_9BACI|nr:LysM peptidoglycan-binding domain-containing protein [Ornithinibacillus halotolerans]GGA71918.1 hypothetical protein GCM10008025_14680 [Ornithinibacillus halotolerans]
MRKIYLSVTATAVILSACAPQQEATPQERSIPHQQMEERNNGQINLQQVKHGPRQNVNQSDQGSMIDEDEHFLTDMSKFYDNADFENDQIHLLIDGMHLHTTPSAFIDGDEVYIPISFISAHLEAGVRYDKEANLVEILKADTNIELFIDADQATVNGVDVETPSFIEKDGTIFVPICFVAEALGYTVEKNIAEDEVKIETHQPEAETFGYYEEAETVQEEQSIPAQAMNQETYTVQAGDSLFLIAKKFNTTVERLKEINGLSDNEIEKGQVLVVLSRPESYTVIAGDTLFTIARKFELTVEQLIRYNELTSTSIQPGQQLSLMKQSSYTVKAGDTLYSIARSFGVTVANIQKWNNLSDNMLTVGQTLKVSERAATIPSDNGNDDTYKVQAGDTLYSIAKRFNVTVDQVKNWNNLSSNMISVGQDLNIIDNKQMSTPSTEKMSTYTVRSGDTLYSIAQRYNTTVDNIKRWNNLAINTLSLGQILSIDGEAKDDTSSSKKETKSPGQKTYTVVKGDTLLGIARRFNTTVDELKRINGLRHDDLNIGRTLTLVGNGNSSTKEQEGVTVSFKTHTVKSGDNLWDLSIQYGIPMLELAKENNLTLNSSLSLGQKITVPVYNVPVKSTVSPNHGEILDWWTEARYVFPVGTVATVKDVKSGKTFKVKHTTGGNHADSEPLTAKDAKIMKEIWGGKYSWTPRAIIINVDGRKLAAAMHSYPHSIAEIKNNNYDGHFCIHFLNSTRHKDGLIQDARTN